MKKILFDTNVILDWLSDRKPFLDASMYCIDKCISKEIKGYLTPHSISDIFYILCKHKDKKMAKNSMNILHNLFYIATEDENTIELIITSKNWKENLWNDIEDSLQMSSAQLNEMDFILTRDPKGFELSKVQFMSPEEFVQMQA